MTPRLTATRLGGAPDRPLLVLGPSLGTSARTLWTSCAPRLAERFEVLAFDLPGHGSSSPAEEPFTTAELAAAVLRIVDDLLAERGGEASFDYAGVSLGGAIGLELLLAAPERIRRAALICTGAKIGEPEGWAARALGVRGSGTSSLVGSMPERWFAPGFVARDPDQVSALLHALSDIDDESYALACECLAAYDVRDRLVEIDTPVLAIAGADDPATPPASLEEIASGVRLGTLRVVDDASHLAPVEHPAEIARLITAFLSDEPLEPEPTSPEYDAGLAVRREVLGDAHVDRATDGITDLDRDFQELITRYAWGSVWTRPGLDRRSRSMITLTALIAGGHHDELALHLLAARRNGLTDDEIAEVLLQAAVYCGVPAANTAFKIAKQTLAPEEKKK